MCGKGMGADFVLALPTGELAIMDAEIFKKELAAAEDKDAKIAELSQKYKDIYFNLYKGAEYGIVDDIIDPSEMREAIYNIEPRDSNFHNLSCSLLPPFVWRLLFAPSP